MLVADCSVLNTYAPRWDLLVNLTQSPQVKTFSLTLRLRLACSWVMVFCTTAPIEEV